LTMASPRTPTSHLQPEDVEAAIQKQSSTPGGLKMEIVLTPALKSGPRTPHRVSPSPVSSSIPLEDRLSAAESRRIALDTMKAANLSDRLSKVEIVKTKKEELVTEKSAKAKEDMEAKLEKSEVKRLEQLQETKERMSTHLARVDKAQKDLEIQTEAARLATEFALKAKMMKAEENKDGQLENMLKKIKEHEEYVFKVRANQEAKLKPYLADLETNIKEKVANAEKRREEVIEKVVEHAREDSKKAEIVRMNKARLQEGGAGSSDTVPESA